MSEMTLNEERAKIYEEYIRDLKAKIKKQGAIVNERDLNHLDNLNQLYNSLIMKQGRRLNEKYKQRK